MFLHCFYPLTLQRLRDATPDTERRRHQTGESNASHRPMGFSPEYISNDSGTSGKFTNIDGADDHPPIKSLHDSNSDHHRSLHDELESVDSEFHLHSPPDVGIQDKHAFEISKLHSQLGAMRNYNEAVQTELRLYKNIGIQNSPLSGSRLSQTGSRTDAPFSLEEHLEDIQALRKKLEESINQNDHLRESLELQLSSSQHGQSGGE